MPTISVHVDDDTFKMVGELAEQQDRSKSWIVCDALQPYLEHRRWMVEQIQQSLADVRSGKAGLVDHADVVRRSLEQAKKLDQ